MKYKIIELVGMIGVIFAAGFITKGISTYCQKTIPEPKITYNVITIEGCEYFDNKTYFGLSVYTHKGNCTNSIHIYNK